MAAVGLIKCVYKCVEEFKCYRSSNQPIRLTWYSCQPNGFMREDQENKWTALTKTCVSVSVIVSTKTHWFSWIFQLQESLEMMDKTFN